ncbi:hypothetical protein NDU88_001147 [Pleurodeles waltl]|uniref:Uncharacterized protein n=1 Tax=Pleurodeles waltl TaxID=8319 RepID=A0AAV7M4G4_PLEWA|nr:hypothetical protein NDU88_001147 [Pleurodeles waltl]
MEQYTTTTPLPQRQTHMCGSGEALRVPATAEEPSRAELLAAIQGARVALEGKIEMVGVEVNILRADLHKVSDKVKVADGSVVDLQTETSRKGFLEVKAKLRAMNIRYMLFYPARLKVISRSKSHFFDHPEEVWRWLEMWDRVGPGRSGQSGVGSARTSGVDGTDWRRRGEGQTQVSGQQCDNSVSRIEIQQDGTMVVVNPEQTIELADSLEGGVEMLSVDS